MRQAQKRSVRGPAVLLFRRGGISGINPLFAAPCVFLKNMLLYFQQPKRTVPVFGTTPVYRVSGMDINRKTALRNSRQAFGKRI